MVLVISGVPYSTTDIHFKWLVIHILFPLNMIRQRVIVIEPVVKAVSSSSRDIENLGLIQTIDILGAMRRVSVPR